MFCFFNSVEKRAKIYIAIYIYLRKPVFKVNIHYLPQFVNHTVANSENYPKIRIMKKYS